MYMYAYYMHQVIHVITYRRWGDKTSYLKNVKCSGEPKNMAALTLEWMGQPSFYHATVALSFQIEISNLDRTKSGFLATSLYKKVIFTKNWVTRFCRPSDDIMLLNCTRRIWNGIEREQVILAELMTINPMIYWIYATCSFNGFFDTDEMNCKFQGYVQTWCLVGVHVLKMLLQIKPFTLIKMWLSDLTNSHKKKNAEFDCHWK